MEVEHQFKSIISYIYTQYFSDDLNSYLILENYEYKNNVEKRKVQTLIRKIERIIKRKTNESSQNSIKHYYNTNSKIIPFWVLSNYLTMGHIVYFYKYIPTKIKNKVNRDLSYFVTENKKGKISNFINTNTIYLVIENVHSVRNIAAHNNMILNYKCEYDIPYNFDIHDEYNVRNIDNKQDIFNVFISFKYFLEKKQYDNIHNKFRKAINTLKKNIDNNHYISVINAIGFKELEKRF